jgi:hypothetical protein
VIDEGITSIGARHDGLYRHGEVGVAEEGK